MQILLVLCRITSLKGAGMQYRIARFLQLLGLIVLPVAIAGNVAEKLNLKESLMMSAVGAVLFLLGWIIQQGSKPS
jgi:hypothetical protein